MIYLDNAATTQVSSRVMNAMLPYFTEHYGNAGSMHSMGAKAAKAIQKARKQCANPINASPDSIIFTSGGSEANTLAIRGLEEHLKSAGKTHIITSKVEHPSVLKAMQAMESMGFEVDYLTPDQTGDLDINQLISSFKESTGLVSIMTANNETGNGYDINSIGAECKKRGVFFHTDCVQAYGGVDIDVEESNIDFLSVSGHKFHAPKGIGFLYARNKDVLTPATVLGGGQEFSLRSGTENVPAIVGIGEAAEDAYNSGMWTRNKYKQKIFLNELRALLELGSVRVNGCPSWYSKTINLCCEGVDGETLLLLLNNEGVYVSAGSACSAHSAKPSHVLTAMGLSDRDARSSIRISFSAFTSPDEMRDAARIIKDSIFKLRGV